MATSSPQVTGKTEKNGIPKYSLRCNCEVMWSLAQQFAMHQIVEMQPANVRVPDRRELETTDPRELHEESIDTAQPPEKASPSKKSQFIGNYAVRARRIAAAYARMYLEEFEYLGDKAKVDRFYWPGLAAFAARQVAVTLEELEKPKHWATEKAGIDTRKMMYTELGKGNLWVYNDILPWYYTYAVDPESFDLCMDKRDSRQFVDQVQKNLAAQQAYEQIKNLVPYETTNVETGERAKSPGPGFLKATKLIRGGFKEVAKWEKAASSSDTRGKLKAAYGHLIAIARHEQGEVLQILIYENENFVNNLSRQRFWTPIVQGMVQSLVSGDGPYSQDTSDYVQDTTDFVIPQLQLVLTSADDIPYSTRSEFISRASDYDTILENYRSRMAWITAIANKYHKFMQGEKRKFMHGELTKIAGWRGLPDIKSKIFS